jgi:hypothetical protein
VLQAAHVPFRHVEVVVARLVGDEVLRVHRAAEPLVVVVQPGEGCRWERRVPEPTAAKVKVFSSWSCAGPKPANSTRT